MPRRLNKAPILFDIFVFAGGAAITVLMFCGLYSSFSSTSFVNGPMPASISKYHVSNSPSDGSDGISNNPPAFTFYDDPSVSYNISSRIGDWDAKCREWLRLHSTYAADGRELLLMLTGSQPGMATGMELRKVFIGGISWETNEDGLREYFSKFGEVVEVLIMKDRVTGRGRGFGFVVFEDPAVAERVVMERHIIDGRMVEAKKAVPRDDQQIFTRNNSSARGSPGPAQTKKIFVGGLPSSITEIDFKNYFDQFGTITDVVVMYDQNTKRPRGFGFITYDSEDAVDKVLFRTFHELNGKLVEVKRAVPKELSPGPSMRSPISGNNYNLNRVNSSTNGYSKGYNLSLTSDHDMIKDSRIGSLASGKNGFLSFGPGLRLDMDYPSTFASSLIGNSSFNDNLGYEQSLTSYYSTNSTRYNSPIPDDVVNENISSVFSSAARSVWEDTKPNCATNSAISNASLAFGSGGLGRFCISSLSYGNSSSPISSQIGGNGSIYNSGNLGCGIRKTFDFGGSNFERRISHTATNTALSSGYDKSHPNLYGNSLAYGDPTWRSFFELDRNGTLSYRPGNSDSDITGKGFADYIGVHNAGN
ncbi:heterogeneous nuclear ribonucleoprotein 1-like [Canna indica]|uniref:Heterogeneous nuclear ribonucleoprotein 1-like n=1 Tax=Canna indica TaxID=4628 RepID=A0AAQ3QF28_9LILI|nr:heterogeneous nuclear ribonucleoprotein 1-like [Canna indica]